MTDHPMFYGGNSLADIRSQQVCPLCGGGGAHAPLRAIVDAGTKTTQLSPWFALAAPKDFKLIAAAALYAGDLNPTTTTQLAERLAPWPEPRLPHGRFFVLFLLYIIGFCAIFAVTAETTNIQILEQVVAVLVYGFICIEVNLAVKAHAYKELAPTQKAWRRGMQRWEAAQYCIQDDVIYGCGEAGHPEDYLTWAFTGNRGR